MTDILIHLLITSLLVMFVAYMIKGIEVDSWLAALCGAVVLGIINVVVYPVVVFLTLPFTFLTLGLFLLVIHALMFKLAAGLVRGFRVRGFLPAVFGSIALTLMNLVVGWVV